MSFVSIVVPVYHNAASLPDLLTRFQALARINATDRFEFVFVDDGSRDDSFRVLQDLSQHEPRMRLIKLSRNFGSNAALLAGLGQARGEVVAAISADLQDPPELLSEMLAHWRQGRKVVLAARASRGDSPWTSLPAHIFYLLFRRFAISSMPRGGFDFFLIDRQVCDLLTQIGESNTFLMGLILWLGFEPAVVHYHRQERLAYYGRSMWTVAKKLKYFADAFVAFSYAPLRAASLVGLGLCGLGLGSGLIVMLRHLLFAVPVAGWTSVMIVLLTLSGTQLLMLGILGEYLWRNLEQSRHRPPYVIDHTLEFSSEAMRDNSNPSRAA
ncbi:MAG TPA: glycosyltransferase family 2 protein [Planctomycetaceae bacterium]|jgi:dolichol-phosphate mannosyltransferase